MHTFQLMNVLLCAVEKAATPEPAVVVEAAEVEEEELEDEKEEEKEIVATGAD